jgi:hypothetical protein
LGSTVANVEPLGVDIMKTYLNYGLEAFWKQLTTADNKIEIAKRLQHYNMFWERRHQSSVWHQIVVNEYHAQHYIYVKKNSGL